MAYEYDELHTHLAPYPEYSITNTATLSTDVPVGFGFEQEQVFTSQVNADASFYLTTTKRIFDIAFSLVVMALGLPAFFIILLITKLTSRGPVFFKQQRLGKNGQPFYIYKFRSMRVDAEKFGPQLSSKSDPRITKWGRVLRKTRLDELPQFWNVLIGDMSIVGPRPERQYFVDKIVEKRPDYQKLHNLKPGITSLGQVAYGYAENVDEMCERMRFDLRYLRAVSFRTDCSVIVKTVGVMFALKGK